MALTPPKVAALTRLQGAAEEVRDSARAAGRNHEQLGHIGDQVKALIDRGRAELAGTGEEEAEFAALFPDEEQLFWRDAEPRVSALVGWLRGAVEAAVLQARIVAEAQAYAEARVREERGVGFRSQA